MKKETQNNNGLAYFINDANKKELEGMNNLVYTEAKNRHTVIEVNIYGN